MEGAEGDWAVFCPKRVHLGESLEPFRRFSEFMFQPIKEEPDSAPSDSEIAEANDDKSKSESLEEFSDNPSAIEKNRVSGLELTSSSDSSCGCPRLSTCDDLELLSSCHAEESNSEVQRILANVAEEKGVGVGQKISATPMSNILTNDSEACENVGPETKKNVPKTNLYVYNIAAESSNADRSVKTIPYWELCQEESNIFLSSCGMSCSLSLSSDHHGCTRSTSTDVSESSELFEDDSFRCRTQKKKSVTFLDTEKLHIFSEMPPRRKVNISRVPESYKTKQYSKLKKKNSLDKHGDKQTNTCGKRVHVSYCNRKTPRQETGKASVGASHSGVSENVKQTRRRAIGGANVFVGTFRSSSIESVRASLCNRARKEWSRERRTKSNPQSTHVTKIYPDPSLSEKATSKHIRFNETGINAESSRRFETTHRCASKQHRDSESSGVREDSEKRSLDERLLEALLYQKRDRMRRSRSVEIAPSGVAFPGKTTPSPKRATTVKTVRSFEKSKNRSSCSEKPSKSTSSVPRRPKSSGLKKLHKAARPRKKPCSNIQRKQKKKLNPETRSASRKKLMSSKSEVSLTESKKKCAQKVVHKKRNLPRRKCARKLESCHLLTNKELDAAKCPIKHHGRVRRARSEPTLKPNTRSSTTKKVKYKRSNSERQGRVINLANHDKRPFLKNKETNDRIKGGASTSQRARLAQLAGKSRAPSFKRSRPLVNNSPDSSGARYRTRKRLSSCYGGTDTFNRRTISKKGNQRKDGFRLAFASPYQRRRLDHSKTGLCQQLNDFSSFRKKKTKKKREVKSQRKKFAPKSDKDRTYKNVFAPSPSNSFQENHEKSNERETLRNYSFHESDSFRHEAAADQGDVGEQPFLEPEDETVPEFEEDVVTAAETCPSAAEPEGRSALSGSSLESDSGEFWCKGTHCVKNVSRKFVGLLQNGVEKLMRDVTSTFELVSVMEELAVKEIVQGQSEAQTGLGSSVSEGRVDSSEVLLVSLTSDSEHCWTPKFSDS